MGIKKKAIAIILLVVTISMTFTACQGIEAFRQLVKLPENLIPTKRTTAPLEITTEPTTVFGGYEEEATGVEENGNPFVIESTTAPSDEPTATTKSASTTKNNSTTKQKQTTTKKGSLPPKAPKQDGEWGNPIKN